MDVLDFQTTELEPDGCRGMSTYSVGTKLKEKYESIAGEKEYSKDCPNKEMKCCKDAEIECEAVGPSLPLFVWAKTSGSMWSRPEEVWVWPAGDATCRILFVLRPEIQAEGYGGHCEQKGK